MFKVDKKFALVFVLVAAFLIPLVTNPSVLFVIANPYHGGPPTAQITSPVSSETYGANVPVYVIVQTTAYTTAGAESISSLDCILDGLTIGIINGSGFFKCLLCNVSYGFHNLTVVGKSNWGHQATAQANFSVGALSSAVDEWVPKAAVSNILGYHATVFNGQIYDFDYSSTSSTVLKIYDPKSDIWIQKTIAPLNSYNFDVASAQGTIYVMNADGSSGFTCAYDLRNETWITKATNPMFLSEVRLNVVDGKIYVTGRHWSSTKLSNRSYSFIVSQPFEVFNPSSNSWSQLTPVPTPVNNFAFASLNGKIYIIGGELSSSTATSGAANSKYTNLIQIFDIQTNRWTQTFAPNVITSSACCSTTQTTGPQRIYIISAGTTQIYQPENNQWTSGTLIPSRSSPELLLNINEKLYALGGIGGNLMYAPMGLTQESWISETSMQFISAQPNQTLEDSPSPTTDASSFPLASVPEFPAWLLLPVVLATVAATIIVRRKLKS
jgi:hypothetical protein